MKSFATLLDIRGQTFTRLTVIDRAANYKNGSARWRCRCECGNEVIAIGQKLRDGRVKSCGCYNRDVARQRMQTHGESSTRLFKIWGGMLNRCSNPRNRNWPNYGGRGIAVCAPWASSYEAFRDWSVSNGYADNLSIDRINNDGDYEPSNCRWATVEVQSINKRNNVRLKDGRLAHAVSEVGHAQLRARMLKGMTLDEAALTPSKRPRHLMPDGVFASDVALANGISIGTFNMRISKYGWDAVRAATTPVRPIRNHLQAQP